VCPIQLKCAAKRSGIAETLPRKRAKQARPIRRGTAFVALREDGAVLLRQRPGTGLLARMMEVPSSEWLVTDGEAAAIAGQKLPRGAGPVRARWHRVPGQVVHTFTHFKLELEVVHAVVPLDAGLTIWADAERCRWVARRDLDGQALPSVMRKVLAHALAEIAG
ncbi:MAG: NUDIX domain-containing protein, partial [Pseudomonadota bacterium]